MARLVLQALALSRRSAGGCIFPVSTLSGLPFFLVFTFATLGATQCYAQDQKDQDVAEAARQEQSGKQEQPKKSKHVYTAEDLKREHILTPEDRAQLEAKKNQSAPTVAQKPQDAPEDSSVAREADTSSVPANAPLGEVARHLRKQKESQKLERSAEFHLPFSDTPALASPRPPAEPLRPPVTVIAPAPRVVSPTPYQPPVRRSPFERPRVLPPRVTTPRPLGPDPRAPVPALTPRLLSTPPPAPVPPSPSTLGKLAIVIVKPGDSLWRFAALRLGDGRRWRELLSLNPGLRDPNLIPAGTQLLLPGSVARVQTLTKYTVRHGDTLWTIAQTHFGHATSWSCIARANSELRDANLIREGQILLLPGSCTP